MLSSFLLFTFLEKEVISKKEGDISCLEVVNLPPSPKNYLRGEIYKHYPPTRGLEFKTYILVYETSKINLIFKNPPAFQISQCLIHRVAALILRKLFNYQILNINIFVPSIY